MAEKIYPTETGYIVDETINIGRKSGEHIQGIAQLGNEYTVLSASYDNHELIVALGAGNRKKVVHDQALPKGYEHAGGIDVLKVKHQGWWIVVPVYSEDPEDKGAILHYFFSKKNGVHKLELRHITELDGAKAYAVGTVRTSDNRVVIAVVVDPDGNKVRFWEYDDSNGIGKSKERGLWKENQANKCKWKDENWGNSGVLWDRGYPNSISLIEHGGQIYFVGMHNNDLSGSSNGDDWIDIYSVNFSQPVEKWLIKTQNFHAICTEPPSFRWGGNARIKNNKVEILAVEKDVQENALQGNVYIRYDKFYLDIDDSGKLKKPKIPTDPITIS